MKERLLSWILTTWAKLAPHVADFLINLLKKEAYAISLDLATSAHQYVLEINDADIPGSEKRQWVADKLKAQFSTTKSRLINAAIENALLSITK